MIAAWFRMNGGIANRVNTTGIYNPHTKTFRRSGATIGAADINAVYNGKSIQIEVKAGKDRPREEQLKQQELFRAAGAIYEFVPNFDEFLKLTIQWKEEDLRTEHRPSKDSM